MRWGNISVGTFLWILFLLPLYGLSANRDSHSPSCRCAPCNDALNTNVGANYNVLWVVIKNRSEGQGLRYSGL